MITQQSHEMRLETRHESGAEEWYCPTCGRKFLLDWPPKYKKIILDIGDESAIHNGGKGGLSMRPPEIGAAKEPALPEAVRATLEKILEKFDLDDPSVDSTQHNK
jgi:hypothetical protein